MKEFWPELLTKASWEKLQELKKELTNFVVIGGWSVYLWTGLHKSKDIDILVDFAALEQLRENYDLRKNPQLKKYEIKSEKFDIDIYVVHYSEFPIPAKELMEKYTASVQGFTTLKPEALVVLKQSAEIGRRGSTKGQKDAIDILSLLLRSPFNVKTYMEIVKAYSLDSYIQELKQVISTFDPKTSSQLGLGFKEFQDWKKLFLKALQTGGV